MWLRKKLLFFGEFCKVAGIIQGFLEARMFQLTMYSALKLKMSFKNYNILICCGKSLLVKKFRLCKNIQIIGKDH